MFIIIEHNLKPTISHIAEARARQIATEAVNNAIKAKIADSVNYDDLISVRRTLKGRLF